MDLQAFFKLSYGLYVVSSSAGGRDAGCVVNTLQQVTNEPNQLAVTVNKENFTCGVIGKSGHFAASVLLADVDMDVIRGFGFRSSADVDKFAEVAHQRDHNDLPYLTQGAASRFSCRVTGQLDVGTHILYVGEVTEAEVLSQDEVMTYAYYHQVKNGKTPPKASSYQAQPDKKGWRCTVCGYVYEGDPLPEDFVCPVCGVAADQFQRITSAD